MVDIIPKEIPIASKASKILFYLSLVFLVVSIVGYFILNNALKTAQGALEDLELALIRTSSPAVKNLELEILKTKNKMENFSPLISQHLKTSKIFEIIQKTTHPKVWFSEFDFSPREGLLKISGEAQNFEALGQQILIFQGEETIAKTNLEDTAITKEGKIKFTLSLFFKPETFK